MVVCEVETVRAASASEAETEAGVPLDPPPAEVVARLPDFWIFPLKPRERGQGEWPATSSASRRLTPKTRRTR